MVAPQTPVLSVTIPSSRPEARRQVEESYPGQIDGYRQGIQTIFAGFIEATTARGISPSIRNLWVSDQLHFFLPSLRDILSVSGVNSSSGEYDTGTLQRMLLVILQDRNKLSRPCSTTLTELPLAEKIDIPWKLTRLGRKMGIVSALLTFCPESGKYTPPITPSSRSSIYEIPWWRL